MDTPVVLILFKRPDTTARVFEAVRQARPSTLFVIADGPRPDHPGDAAKCAATRAVIEQVDWPCEVRKHYADENMGCKQRVASGLDWVFEQTEEAIILEDDCLPHPSFFPYCEALLAQYRHDERVMHINGNNYGTNHHTLHPHSYGFCRFAQVWGWATWRRAWQYYDVSMPTWPAFRDGGWLEGLPLKNIRKQQEQRWEDAYTDRVDTWDFQWHFAVMSQHGLAISPTHNLISNLGFSSEATHTLDPNSVKANVATQPMAFPLRHPPFVCTHPAIDAIYASRMMGDTVPRKIVRTTKKLLRLGAPAS